MLLLLTGGTTGFTGAVILSAVQHRSLVGTCVRRPLARGGEKEKRKKAAAEERDALTVRSVPSAVHRAVPCPAGILTYGGKGGEESPTAPSPFRGRGRGKEESESIRISVVTFKKNY
jgi:hypothetical protein